MRLAGIVLIGIVPMCLGFKFAANLNNRVKYIELFIKLICRCRAAVEYEFSTLFDIYQKICNSPEFTPLGLKKIPPAEFSPGAFCNMLMSGGSLVPPDGEANLIKEFISGLGSSDISGQISHCNQYEKLFSEHLSSAKEALKTKQKLYLSLGVFGGLFLMIMMI